MRKWVLLIILGLFFLPFWVNAESKYLYDVLKSEVENNGLAKEYTGDHHDSFIEEPSKKVYHWYAENDEEGNQILEKNNVIFGGFCWQIIRTTDSGGVKLLYSGVPNGNTCNLDNTIIGYAKYYNSTSQSLSYVGYMYNPSSIIKWSFLMALGSGVYGNGVSYNNGLYTLTNTSSAFDSTHRYSCNIAGGYLEECESVYYHNSANTYIKLDDGRNITELFNDMISGESVNSDDSIIKSNIDEWYANNLIDYNSYLEDTIFCNDRSIIDYGSYNPNGSTSNYVKFKSFRKNDDLSCTNETDKFSINNSKARLTYPVGLISYQEVNLLNNYNARKSSSAYWTISPREDNSNYNVNANGKYITQNNNSTSLGVRPSISLKSNIKYSSGSGNLDDPYIVDYNTYYSINVEIINKTEELNIALDDISQVEQGKEVNFKITPIKGFKIKEIKILDDNNNEIMYSITNNKNYTFIMPDSNVTIIPSYERVSNVINVEEVEGTKEISIEVNNVKAVVYEDTVKLTIVPEDGYEVESIEIIDKNNNKIKYRKTKNKYEYEFTMPDTDVTIKPIYRKIKFDTLKNPNTGAKYFSIMLIITIGLSSGLMVYKKKRI